MGLLANKTQRKERNRQEENCNNLLEKLSWNYFGCNDKDTSCTLSACHSNTNDSPNWWGQPPSDCSAQMTAGGWLRAEVTTVRLVEDRGWGVIQVTSNNNWGQRNMDHQVQWLCVSLWNLNFLRVFNGSWFVSAAMLAVICRELANGLPCHNLYILTN